MFVTEDENPTRSDLFPSQIEVEAVNVGQALAVANVLPTVDVRVEAFGSELQLRSKNPGEAGGSWSFLEARGSARFLSEMERISAPVPAKLALRIEDSPAESYPVTFLPPWDWPHMREVRSVVLTQVRCRNPAWTAGLMNVFW